MSIFHPRSWLKRSSRSPQGSERRPVVRTRPLVFGRLGVEWLEDRIVPSPVLLNSYTGLNNAQNAPLNGGFLFEPPDTQGAAGPNNYVETVNDIVGIFSPKNTGTASVVDGEQDFYFTQGGLPPLPVAAGNSVEETDSFAVFDPQIQRFIIGCIAVEVDSTGATVNNGQNALLLAVSKTDTPATLTSADWNFFLDDTTEAGVALQDYPGVVGYNNDALVVTFNSFSTTAFLHAQVDTISMSALTSATPLSVGTNVFQTDVNAFRLAPASMPDAVPGGPEWLVQESGTGNSIDVIEMTNVLSAAPTFTTFTLPVNPYSIAVPELNQDGTPILAPGFTDSRIMNAGELNGNIVADHIVSNAAGNLDQVQWYEINVSSGTPTLVQQGDITGGPNTYYAYPGIAINASGDIGVSYIASGPATPNPGMSVYITGRTPTDPLGTMEAPVLVQAGQANYTGFTPGAGREGDMSGINVDSDGSFWIANEFSNTQFPANWGTTIAHFTFPTPLQILPFSATEGIPLVNVPVATFSDFNALPPSSYNATIQWGDGTTSAGLVVQGANSTTFIVEGTHTYSEEGQYTLTVSVSSPQTSFGSVSTTISVADAPLRTVSSGFTFNATIGNFLSNVLLGTFQDTDQTNTPADPQNNPADYVATVFWQDANANFVPATGRIVALGNNTYAVYGDSPFSFATAGSFTIRVLVQDVGGASTQFTDHVNVPHKPAISPVTPIVPEFQADLGPLSLQFVLMEDALTNLLVAEQMLYASFFGPVPHQNQVIPNFINAMIQYQITVFRFDLLLPNGPIFTSF